MVSTERNRLPLIIAAVIAAQSPFAAGQSDGVQPGRIDEMIVFGRNTDLVGVADAATEGSVSGADLLVRPMFKTSELLESMPGMVAVQHSGSGKANQYFLRGFNLDHGTDYTALIDGTPLNMRSHGHGQGYLDVNGLIPETVQGIDYRKGPYRADLGDFSLAGASFIHTIDELERDFISTEAGEYGWRRVAGGLSQEVVGGTFTLVGEYKQYDGPWQQDEDLDHAAIWAKYRTSLDFAEAAFTLSGYEASWRPTEQIPQRIIGSAVCEDVFCSPDPTAEGDTSRWIANASLQGHTWSATLYGQYYDWRMSSNPTYDFQISQFDTRTTLGGRTDRLLLDNDTVEVTIGGNFRHDDIGDVGLDHTRNGVFIDNISDNDITQGSLGAFAEATWYLADGWRLLGGVRADYFDFDVKARNPDSFAGSASDSLVSPKLGLAWAALEDLELYANWGHGFHSNDARGVVNSAAPVPALSEGQGHELGARFSIGDFLFTTAYWWLDQDSELIFVGDSNSVEPKGSSERDGLELTLFWQPLPWLGIDAVYTSSEARYTHNPEGRYVEQAVEEAGQIGFSATRENWELSTRLRYLGPYALTADNSERADSLTTLNVRGAYHWEHLTVYAEIINLMDSDREEIVYYYPAWISGFDSANQNAESMDCAAVDCTMSRTTVPGSLRLGVSYRF